MNCPKCKRKISFVDFCGDAYHGSYDFHRTHEFKFTCPECGATIVKKTLEITESDLKVEG